MYTYNVKFYYPPSKSDTFNTYSISCNKTNIFEQINNVITNEKYKNLRTYSIDITCLYGGTMVFYIYISNNTIRKNGISIIIQDQNQESIYELKDVEKHTDISSIETINTLVLLIAHLICYGCDIETIVAKVKELY